MPNFKDLFKQNNQVQQPEAPSTPTVNQTQPSTTTPKWFATVKKLAADEGLVPQNTGITAPAVPGTTNTKEEDTISAPVLQPESEGTIPAPEIETSEATIPAPEVKPTSQYQTSSEAYNSVSKGQNYLHLNSTDYTLGLKRELQSIYSDQVEPAYNAYKAAEQGYQNGTVSYEAYSDALRKYRYVYNTTAPLWDAYEALNGVDDLADIRTSDSEAINTRLEEWSNAYNSAVNGLADMDTHIAELQNRYTAAERDYAEAMARFQQDVAVFNSNKKRTKEQLEALQTRATALDEQLKALNDLDDEYSRAVGEYRAQSWYLGQMEYVLGAGLDEYKKKYIEENRWLIWKQDAAAEYDPVTGALTDVGMSYTDIDKHIDELSADNEDGHNDEEIAYYYGLKNSGISLAKMNLDELSSAMEHYQQVQSDAMREMAAASEKYLEQVPGWNPSSQTGDLPVSPVTIENDPEYAKARAKYAEAQKWLTRLEQKEMELRYEEKLSQLPEDIGDRTRSVYDDLVITYSGTGDEAKADAEKLEWTIRSALTTLGWSEDEADGLLYMARLEADEITNAQEYDKWYEWAMKLGRSISPEGIAAAQDAGLYGEIPAFAQRALTTARDATGSSDPDVWTATVMSWVPSVVSGLSSGTGAVDLTLQELTNKVDPITGRNRPLNYNTSWQRPYTAQQAIGDAQYQRVFDKLYADTDDETLARKKAQMYQTYYDMSVSMGESTVIAALHAIGVPAAMLLLSGSAATSTMHELHEQGYSDSYAVAAGVISGAAEYITEEYSVEKLLKAFRTGLVGVTGLKQMFLGAVTMGYQAAAEGSEEGASDLVNMFADEFFLRLLNGGVSQIEMNAVAKQEADPSLKWDDAIYESWVDWGKQTGEDIKAGALSGLLMGGGSFALGSVTGAERTAAYGHDIAQAGGQNMVLGAVTDIEDAFRTLLSNDTQKGLGSEYQIGRLANGAHDVRTLEAIKERLAQLGETDPSIELLRGIDCMAADQNLLWGDRRAVVQSQHASQVAEELARWYENQQRIAAGKDAYWQADWTTELGESLDAQRAMFTNPEVAEMYNRVRANRLELAYKAAQRANPGSTVMTPISEQIEQAGADARTAQRQGALLDKIFSGETLTDAELKALDLNNKAVQKVFRERSGLTGMPEGNISEKLKAAYVEQVTKEVLYLKEQQIELTRGLQQLDEQSKANAEERTKSLEQAAKANENAFTPIFNKMSAKENKENRASQEQTQTKTRVSQAQRNNPIDIKGKTSEQIISEISAQTGLDLSGIPRWADYLAEYNRTMSDQHSEEAARVDLMTAQGMYYNRLADLRWGKEKLTNAEIRAITDSQFAESRLTDKGINGYTDEAKGVEENGPERRHDSRGAGDVPVDGGQTGGIETGVPEQTVGGTAATGAEGSRGEVRSDRGVTYSANAWGETPNLSDVENLHLLSVSEYLNKGGTAGPRAELFSGYNVARMMGANNVRYVVADSVPGLTKIGIISVGKDGKQNTSNGFTNPVTGDVLVCVNYSNQGPNQNPVRTACHEGFHAADTEYRLTKEIIKKINADPVLSQRFKDDLAVQSDTEAYDNADQERYASEIFADAFARKQGRKIKTANGVSTIDYRPYFDVVLDTVKAMVPGFNPATYYRAMRIADTFYDTPEKVQQALDYYANEALYDGMDGAITTYDEAADKKDLLRGVWDIALANQSKLQPVTPAPSPAVEQVEQTQADEQAEEKKAEPKKKVEPKKPKTAKEKAPAEVKQISRDDYLHEQLGDPAAKFVDTDNVRKLAATDQELNTFEYLLRNTGAKFVFVNTEGAVDSKQYFTNGSPTARLRGAVTYVTVKKGDTMADVLVRMRQGMFDQLNRLVSKDDLTRSEMVTKLLAEMRAKGVSIEALTSLAETLYKNRAWDAHILYDCWYDTTNADNPYLTDADRDYADRVNRLIGADKDPSIKNVGRVYDSAKADAMQSRFREWAVYQYCRDLASGAVQNSEFSQQIKDAMQELLQKEYKRISSTWGFERRFEEENKRRYAEEQKWLRENTFNTDKRALNPLTKADTRRVEELFDDAIKRSERLQKAEENLAEVERQIADLVRESYETEVDERVENLGNREVAQFDWSDEDYFEDPRFQSLLNDACKKFGVTDRFAPDINEQRDTRENWEKAWNSALRAYNDELLATRQQYTKQFVERAATEQTVPTREQFEEQKALQEETGDAATGAVGLATEDASTISSRAQELERLRKKARELQEDIVSIRKASERFRDGKVRQIVRAPYQTLAAQLYDDIVEGRKTADTARDIIYGAQKKLAKNQNLIVSEIYGGTISSNYRTNTRSPSLAEYRRDTAKARAELKEAERLSLEAARFESQDEISTRERVAAIFAAGNPEKAEQIRAEEREKREQARRTDALKVVKEAKNEAGKVDADRSETTPTDVRNNLLDELNEARAGLMNAPAGYSPQVRKVASLSNAVREQYAKHARAVTKSAAQNTMQEGSPLWKGTGHTSEEEQTFKDRVLDGMKAAGNMWMYQSFSDCWTLEKAGMKQTRMDGIRNRINMLRGSNETVQYIYSSALVDREGNHIGASMRNTMLCWDESGKNVDKEKQEKLQHYLLLMHDVDRMSVEERAHRAVVEYEELHPELKNIGPDQLARLIVEQNNPIAKEYYRLLTWESGAENKAVLAVEGGQPMNAVTAQKLADDMLTEDPWLAEKAQGIYDWWDMFMREWGIGGRMSEESYENMRNAYPHYVPTYRAGDNKFIGSASYRGSTEISIGPVIHKAKGSTLEILPIEDQFAMLASKYVQGARANELAWNFIQELMFSGEANDADFSEFGQVDYDRTAEDFINERIEDDADPMDKMIEHDEKKHEYRLNCWVNGKQVSAYVSKGIYQSFQNLLKKQSDGYKSIVAAGNLLTSPMKEFITGANPFFAVRNLLRDIPTAIINSTAGLKFMHYWFQAADQLARDSDAWRQFQALGGTHSNMMNMHRGFATETSKRPNALKKAVGALEWIGERSEAVTRFAEYLATIDRLGDTPEARMIAIHNAAEVTVDFGRAGYTARAMNAWSPYFNPAVQGVYKVFRTVFANETKGGGIKALGRAALTTLPIEILAYFLRGICGRDKDFEEESDYIKDSYYLIPLKNGSGHKWFKIPKNREWATVGNLLMRALEAKDGYADPFGTFVNISIKGNFLPDSPIPMFAQWFIDAATNKNFVGGTIVPTVFDEFKEERPMDVYDENTSALAYGIASVATKLNKSMNPMFVDYILNYYMGDFWSNLYTWADMGLIEEVEETDGSKTLTFAKGFKSMLTGFGEEIEQDWITNSLYSNSTMTRYYDMVSKLRGNTAADKYSNGGKATGSLEEQIYNALWYGDIGYSSQITALAKEARGLQSGPEKDAIKTQQIALAHSAMDFYDRCMTGEIKDPVRYVRYSDIADNVGKELTRLATFSDTFEFEPTFSRVSSISDPDQSGYQYVLTDAQKDEYVAVLKKTYSDEITELMQTTTYKAADDAVKAQMLAQKRAEVRAAAKATYLETMRRNGAKPTKKTLADIEVLQLEAKYALARANDPATAVSSTVSDELIRMRDFASDYNFVMSTSVPKTFSRSASSDDVYVLNDRQKDYYTRLRSSRYNEAMESVLLSDEYRNRSEKEKAAMLQATAQLINKQIKTEFNDWLSGQPDTTTTARTSLEEGALEQDAEFAVTRVLTPSDAYSKEVTDELVRLYGYSDAYSFQPSTYRPTGYNDPKRKGYRYELNDAQKDKYQEICHNVYDTAFKVLMQSANYRNSNDEGRAKLLDSMRGQLSEEVREQFLRWLASSGAKSEKKADTSEQKKLDKIVKQIVGW